MLAISGVHAFYGNIEAQVSLENVGNNPFGGNIIMNGNGGVIIRGNVVINGGGMIIGPGGVRAIGAGNGNTTSYQLKVQRLLNGKA